MLQANVLREAFRLGSSVVLVVEADDGRKYVVRYSEHTDDARTLVVDWLSSGLAALLDIPVLLPVTIGIRNTGILPAAYDDESYEILGKLIGVRLAVPCIEGATVLSREDELPLEPADADAIFLFDVLLGNFDRTWDNPGILLADGQFHCYGFSCSMAMRSGLEGRDSLLFQSGVYRRHPCYREEVSAEWFRKRVQNLSDAALLDVAGSVPYVWLNRLFPMVDRKEAGRKVFRALQVVRDRVLRLDAMIAAIERSQVDPEGRRVSRKFGGREAFLACLEKSASGSESRAGRIVT